MKSISKEQTVVTQPLPLPPGRIAIKQSEIQAEEILPGLPQVWQQKQHPPLLLNGRQAKLCLCLQSSPEQDSLGQGHWAQGPCRDGLSSCSKLGVQPGPWPLPNPS